MFFCFENYIFILDIGRYVFFLDVGMLLLFRFWDKWRYCLDGGRCYFCYFFIQLICFYRVYVMCQVLFLDKMEFIFCEFSMYLVWCIDSVYGKQAREVRVLGIIVEEKSRVGEEYVSFEVRQAGEEILKRFLSEDFREGKVFQVEAQVM